jgi:hypothetical protein
VAAGLGLAAEVPLGELAVCCHTMMATSTSGTTTRSRNLKKAMRSKVGGTASWVIQVPAKKQQHFERLCAALRIPCSLLTVA